jgi:hypothetical protein
MPMTLSTHDTGYERLDNATIAKVLASLDGGRNVLATLGASDEHYLQAQGSVQRGFGLDLQEGSLERHYRSTNRALPLEWVTGVFQKYARGDLSWRGEVEWEKEEIRPPRTGWWNSWIAYVVLMAGIGLVIWLMRGR